MNELIVEEFKGYSTFVEITNRMLRAYNQYNVLVNMHENKLDELGKEYIANLPQLDRVGLAIITKYIQAHGLEETKRELLSNGVGA